MINHVENNDSGFAARGIINELVDIVNTVYTGSYTGSFTGSLQGTASWAYSSSQAISSSYAVSASYAPLGNTGSFATTGSNTFIGDQTISGSNINGDNALYFGASGSIGSWRIAPSGVNLVIQKWNGSVYTGGTTITP
jgi:hypothetical protein